MRRELQRLIRLLPDSLAIGAMTDPFSLLGAPRRPWLDLERLKQTFFELSAARHPDRFRNADPEERASAERAYGELNAAYRELSQPRDRLRRLLELERGASPKDLQAPPPAILETFARIGDLCRRADEVLRRKRTETSPILRARLLEETSPLSDEISRARGELQEQRQSLERELEELNQAWIDSEDLGDSERRARLPLDRVEEIYRALGYLGRWTTQLQDRWLELSE